ncbi:alpha/beta hydrolase family protein [Blastococcus xanthinilyticus]|uniref:Alpha/beta hydrolase family protein n=2 Tax=Blastococcus xanthinilyticus TaxID=1564164 RepID=A0A5S5CYS2_9ACTN|nr:alpha/beta hydrolase family protein [Blastococcus xanthinilyticus]
MLAPMLSHPSPEDRSVLTRPASAPDEVLRHGPDAEQVADVRLARGPAGDRPVVVLVHGGFWRPEYDRAHLGPMAEALAAAGWPTVTPEYRRVPGHPGLAVQDVLAAVRAVAGRPDLTRGRRVLLAGHSAGGHLALLAAALLTAAVPEPAEAPAGVLALAPVADLVRAQELGLDGDAVVAFLGGDAATRPDLDPARLPAPAGAVRILHGDGDGVVPAEVSRSYARRHPAAVLTEVPGGHFAVIDPRSAAWPAVLGALEDLAAGA